MEKRRILIVDDEASLTHNLRLYLEMTGRFEVRELNKGSLAINTARQFKPDLILLDIIMPDAEGTDIAAKMKCDPNLQSIPILFLTAAMSREEVGMQGSVVGGHPILAKPVSPKAVVNRIEEMI